jgi:hypothetical protein
MHKWTWWALALLLACSGSRLTSPPAAEAGQATEAGQMDPRASDAGPIVLPSGTIDASSDACPGCFAPDGGYACTGEGQFYDAKLIGRQCCPGLVAIGDQQPRSNCASCEPSTVDPSCTFGSYAGKICTRCGDGTCGLGENRCNCPQDCPGE